MTSEPQAPPTTALMPFLSVSPEKEEAEVEGELSEEEEGTYQSEKLNLR